jgi:cyclohexa-1,5-dienecarbonyl-CoA hydratase
MFLPATARAAGLVASRTVRRSMAELTSSTVALDVRNHAAYITIDRPPLNVLDVPTNQALAAAIRSLHERPDARVVVLQAAGFRAFCAGVEIKDHERESVAEMLAAFHDVFRALLELGRPVIAAVRGAALGGGCELVAFADVAIASDSATFGLPEIKLGCFPPVAALILPQVVGAKRAGALLLGGANIAPHEAKAMGLVNEVVADEGFDSDVMTFVERFTRHSGAALAIAHEAYRPAALGGRSPAEFLDALSRIEALYVEKLMATADAHEGIAAWLEKREPRWTDT